MRIILYLFVMFPFLLNAADGDTLNRIDSLGKRQGFWKITAAMRNKVAQYPSPDFIIEEGHYLDHQKTGTWIEYWPNGNMKSRMNYVKNRPNGTATLFFENGHVSETGTWAGTRWIGEYRKYYESDTLHMLLHFNTLGQRDGLQQYFHPNGKLMVEAYYKSGKEDSVYREYYDDGSLKREMFYSSGTIDPSKTKEHAPPPGAHWPEENVKREEIQYNPMPGHREIHFNAPSPNRKDSIHIEQGKRPE